MCDDVDKQLQVYHDKHWKAYLERQAAEKRIEDQRDAARIEAERIEVAREKWRSEPVREHRIRAVRLDCEDVDSDDMVNGFVDLTVDDDEPVKKKQRRAQRK